MAKTEAGTHAQRQAETSAAKSPLEAVGKDQLRGRNTLGPHCKRIGIFISVGVQYRDHRGGGI